MTIDEVLKITCKTEEIDGDVVYIIENDMAHELEELKKKIKEENGNRLFLMLSSDVEFILSHTDFAIGFRPIRRMNSRRWLPCLLYKFNDKWRRIILQYANCLNCDWSGNIANPTEPDLYVTMENKFDILEAMNQLSFYRCPKCGKEISGKAIWIEMEKKEGIKK